MPGKPRDWRLPFLAKAKGKPFDNRKKVLDLYGEYDTIIAVSDTLEIEA
jgi:hypothetical protein